MSYTLTGQYTERVSAEYATLEEAIAAARAFAAEHPDGGYLIMSDDASVTVHVDTRKVAA